MAAVTAREGLGVIHVCPEVPALLNRAGLGGADGQGEAGAGCAVVGEKDSSPNKSPSRTAVSLVWMAKRMEVAVVSLVR